jgi:hypothetical protein
MLSIFMKVLLLSRRGDTGDDVGSRQSIELGEFTCAGYLEHLLDGCGWRHPQQNQWMSKAKDRE